MVKCVLKVSGEDVKIACGSANICASLEVGIEGATHSVTAWAEANNTMEFSKWEVNINIREELGEANEVHESLMARLQ